MSMAMAIRSASLWTHAMFAVIADLHKSGLCSVDLTHDSRADLVSEFKQWLSIAATSQEGPWQRAWYFATALTKGSSDASSVAWGGHGQHDLGHLPRREGCFRQTGCLSISTTWKSTVSTIFCGRSARDTRMC